MTKDLKSYDVIVIGSGSGMTIVEEALSDGLKVALVDKGPFGGTCLNLGCIPSKILISPADRIAEIQDSKKLGIDVRIEKIDFASIMNRMRKSIREDQDDMRKSMRRIKSLDFYETEAYFIQDYTLKVSEETIQGKKIFIAAGSRPFIPPITGLDRIDYLTSETLLDLKQKPESILIIGGGYVGVEYAHFLAAMGSKVTIVEMSNRLVPAEEPEISDLLRQKLSRRMDVVLNTQVLEFNRDGKKYKLRVKNRELDVEGELEAETVMIAAGRRSNADLLKVENTGVEVDKSGYIRVDEYLETTRKQIYALGDVIGKYMFTHAANREAILAWHNAMHGEPTRMDYRAVPHAIFTYPQVASVGLTEAEARKEHRVLVGKAKYTEVAKGISLLEEDSFAKAIIEAGTNKILGFHIIGAEASTLIQEVINTMAAGGEMDFIQQAMHIHPAMPEIILKTLSNLKEQPVVEIKSERLKATVP